MIDATTTFAKYAANELKTYGSAMYDLFADICEKVINGDTDAKEVLETLVKYTQKDIYREQQQLHIDFSERTKEYRDACELMDTYIEYFYCDDDDIITFQYMLPKKFYDEIFMFFYYNDEGKKCMEEFNPSAGKIEEVSNMIQYIPALM